jgi:hypothetical protein
MRVDHPAPAAASPQAALLADLWAATHEAADGYEGANGADARNYAGGALDATQEAVTATLVHLYGMARHEAQGRVQRALAAGNDDAQALL